MISGTPKRRTQPAEHITGSAAVNLNPLDGFARRVLIRSHPTNAGFAWVNIGAAAAVGTGWPLNIGDGLELSVSDLNEINILLESDNDKFTVLYEK